MKKKITLKDIAEHCDLAATTVSRILRDKPTYCSAAKIEMVKRIAKEWDYRPNIGYHIMTGRSTNIAALIFSQFRSTQDDQTNRLYMALSKGLDLRDFASYTAVMDENMDSQLRKIRDLDERGCRYYIFLGTPSHDEPIYAFLERQKRCYVGFDNNRVPRRIVPDRAGAYLEYHRLAAEQGMKNFRIAVTSNYFDRYILPRVGAGEREQFRRDHLLEVPPIRLRDGSSCDYYFTLGQEIMERALHEYPDIHALAFTTDYHVFGAADVLQKKGLAGKVQLFGMRDAVASGFVKIPFTTVRFDVEYGAELILDHLSDPGEWEFVLPGKLITYNN